ncbi:MAG: DUF4834 domain-containing protein [Flavobacteriaceae bacterium]|nr:DUF4834 domain-containing protein [Flavobacteriales bacterium]MDG1271727.1 DUF4834 domain-containing protein [Flavobacteriaceae bacterium]
MIKFLVFLFLGIYLLRSILRGVIHYFVKNILQQQSQPSQEQTSKKKQRPDSKNVGEYIDYEEID